MLTLNKREKQTGWKERICILENLTLRYNDEYVSICPRN